MEKGIIANQLRTTIIFLGFFSVLFGLCYPGLSTLLLQMACSEKANGSLVVLDNQIRGSWLIGQHFTQDHYFWGRPSALQIPYRPTSSGGSNYSPTNEKQLALIKARVDKLKHSNPMQTALIPIDLVTASASGLDPHISLAAALYQVPRVAKARGIEENKILELIIQHCPSSMSSLLGTAHVNVLNLNIALDKVSQSHYGDTKTGS
jgi:K+-transporting ATPase ATPase C chain